MSRKLEITAISAEELTDGGKPVKKSTFVSFEIAGGRRNQSMSTSLDEVGGNYPIWSDKLETEFSTETSKESFMYVKVFSRNLGKDKHVGTARVPVKVFTGEYAPVGFLHCLSYRLWDDYGRRNGLVNFSAKVSPEKSGRFSGERTFWLR
ncbi:unnamed protein product [Arabis nemorensis]|uniref:C2 domain-containing protein n=1 Tax=Arabis nemorensis TaxID=586526 RepID=A0A565BZQ2_9BRAS|nr:unnamed protein product [Arabis nemorensis]